MRRNVITDPQLVRKLVSDGISEIAKPVKKTLGPSGRPILIEIEPGQQLITKDGVTVAKYFASHDSITDSVAAAARQACERTVTEAGDGTTTAIVLAEAIVNEAQKFLDSNPSYSPQKLSRELKQIFHQTIEPAILDLAKPLRGLPIEEAKRAVRHVAMVSSNHDEQIADVVAEGVEYVGEDGMVVAEDGAGSETTVVHQSGFPVFGGLNNLGGSASTAFVNRPAFSDCVLGGEDGVYLVLYDGEINDFNTLLPIFQQINNEMDSDGHPLRRPVLVVAHGFGNQVLVGMAKNFRTGAFLAVPFVTVRSGTASSKQTFLHDLAAYVGAKVYDPQANFLEQATLAGLGFAEKVRMAQHETVIMAEPELELVEKRIEELKEQMKTSSEYDKDRIRYRIGQMTGGISTIYAGGSTAIEAKERHARLVDAISAVRSAMQKGVIPGGGATLAVISRLFETLPPSEPGSVFANALKAPFQQILVNAEYVKSDADLVRYLAATGIDLESKFQVFDSLKGKFVEWYEGGIMDPAKVTLCALDSALSVAKTIMTLGGLMITEASAEYENMKAMQEGIFKAVQNGEV